MYNNGEVAVIIAAAGSGKRLGTPVPKQYLKIGSDYILAKTIRAFEKIDAVDSIFIVANVDYHGKCAEIVSENGFSKIKGIIAGGKERQDSVFNAIKEINFISPDADMILIHDAARPYVDEITIMNVIKSADDKGAAVCCVPMKDSIRKVVDRKVSAERSLNTGAPEIGGLKTESVDRSKYYAVQTPQGFKKSILMESYALAFAEGFMGTDDASVVEHAGFNVSIVEGNYDNIKITTKEDLPMETRIGTGFDVHELVSERDLILGGVNIPHEKGLLGHSDADVLVHALMDALLGAAALGDIGKHFPDTDMKYKGISSIELLKNVKLLLDDKGFKVSNVDITLMAQRPKIRPYIDEMISNIAVALEVEEDKVNIKGTTTEKLGFVGREEGIAAEAVALLYK